DRDHRVRDEDRDEPLDHVFRVDIAHRGRAHDDARRRMNLADADDEQLKLREDVDQNQQARREDERQDAHHRVPQLLIRGDRFAREELRQERAPQDAEARAPRDVRAWGTSMPMSSTLSSDGSTNSSAGSIDQRLARQRPASSRTIAAARNAPARRTMASGSPALHIAARAGQKAKSNRPKR